MPPSVAFVLGLLAGLAVGALVIAGIVRATSRITGAAPRALPGLVLSGLRPGGPVDGVAAQRALARRLKRSSRRTAAGRRVAATALEVHVSPEDHAAIDSSMGTAAAEADLTDFYRDHANRAGWLVGGPPRLSIVRDISLRPRQSFVRSETRADPSAPLQRGEPDHDGSAREAEPRHDPPSRSAEQQGAASDLRRPVATPAAQPEPRPGEAAPTDVLPRALLDRSLLDQALLDQDVLQTAAYPLAVAEQAAPGDLLVVHGTDVRVVPVRRGLATVGRASHNDVVVVAPGVADDHLLLEHRQRAWWVVPGPSKARVMLEGRPVKAAQRLEGQGVVELGRGARLRLTVEPDR